MGRLSMFLRLKDACLSWYCTPFVVRYLWYFFHAGGCLVNEVFRFGRDPGHFFQGFVYYVVLRVVPGLVVYREAFCGVVYIRLSSSAVCGGVGPFFYRFEGARGLGF